MKNTKSGQTGRHHQKRKKKKRKEKLALLQDLFILGAAVIFVKSFIGT